MSVGSSATHVPKRAWLPRIRRRSAGNVRPAWRQPLAIIGIAVLVAWLLVAALAPLIAPYDPMAQSADLLQAPSSAHWLGTDALGRDVFSRLLYGARLSVPLAVVMVVAAVAVGTVLGALAGYFGGWVDAVVMRFADLNFAFPAIVLALAITAGLGPSLRNAMIAVVFVTWPSYARVVRGLVRSLSASDYVIATRLLGASFRRALTVDVLPNIAGPVLALATLELGSAVLALAALSYLGLGAQAPTAEWGLMIADGTQYFDKLWIGLFPGLAMVSVVLAFNFVGDSLRDALDPHRSAESAGGGR